MVYIYNIYIYVHGFLLNQPILLNTYTHIGAAARRKRRQQQEGGGDDDDDTYFPVMYLAYPERGSGPSLRVALLRWGLEAWVVEEEDEGEEGREEGYRVHIVEVRLMMEGGGDSGSG